MATIDKEDIGGRQQTILQVIWDLDGEATIGQIIDRLNEEYGTKLTGQGINTTMNQLMDKGLIRRERKIHQSFIYEATISQEEFRAREIRRIRNRSFKGSASQMVAALIEDGISQEEYEEILKLIK
jgi:predicted transcriptional regulator